MNPTVTQNILSTLTTLKMSHHKWRVWHNKHKTVLTPTVAPIMTIYKSGCSICLFLPWCCDCYQLTTCQLIFLPMNQSVFARPRTHCTHHPAWMFGPHSHKLNSSCCVGFLLAITRPPPSIDSLKEETCCFLDTRKYPMQRSFRRQKKMFVILIKKCCKKADW